VIGEVLSHYRVTAALGAGGMGEVYRATDTNLGRDVAIKVLPPEVAQDAERLGRFRREAHLLAALNHPHIASIYGLEEADGKPFLVLELVEGEDLRQRLDRGAIPADEALELAEQIAEALEEAHGKGIIHRDLKPANVKVTPDGAVKVLDFGLAKAWAGELSGSGSGSDALSQSPTLARTGTVAGVILGTAAYMSPEQARGRPVDKRTDVWAFGVLLWEMLTGLSLFAGDTVTDVIASVVKEEPDLDALPASTPTSVRRLLERCLRKDARSRLPDIGAARLELQDVIAGRAPGEAHAGVTQATGANPQRERLARVVAALAVAGLAAVLLFGRSAHEPPPRPPAGHFVVDPPEGWRFHSWGWPVPSPDGSQLAFRAVPEDAPEGSLNEDPHTMLWTRPLESPTARLMAGTEHVEHPFWSPDGRFIAFYADGELRKLNLAAGTIQRICVLPEGTALSADWGADGTIVFGVGQELFTVAADGGEPSPLAPPQAWGEGVSRGFPQLLGRGRQLGFIGGGAEVPAGYYVTSLDDPEVAQRVLDGITRVSVARRHAFFLQGGGLVAQPFDVGGDGLAGAPVAIAAPVGGMSSNPGIGWFDVSPGGTLAYLSGAAVSSDTQVAWVDRQGDPLGTLGPPGQYRQVVLSPDGRRVAVEIVRSEDGYDLWIMDVARGVMSLVAAGPGEQSNPVWAPDGESLVFSSDSGAGATLRRKGLRATDPETILEDAPGGNFGEDWSPDGQTLLFLRQPTSTQQSIWALSPDGDTESEPILDVGVWVDEPQLSPDGRWLAYVSRESGRSEVYVEPFRREGERVRVSMDGGGQPKWRRDGRELFLADLDGRLMSVGFRVVDDRAEVDLPKELFELGSYSGEMYDDYAPDATGQRFLVKLKLGAGERPRMHVIVNWPSLLPEAP